LQQDLNFDQILTIDLVFPKTRILRSVLFNLTDLIGEIEMKKSLKFHEVLSTVGFGGAVALFLGFSFLTGIELVYFVIEFILELFVNLISSHIPDRVSVPQKKWMSTPARY
jgi:hypothetical protein